MSLEGDGRLDLVEFAMPAPGFFERADGDKWDAFVPFASVPSIDWRDPNLQMVDLNGDGFADVLITHGTSIIWYPSLAKRGFGAAITISVPTDERKGPALVFADGEQSFHLADLSGDGLSDLVRIRNGEVCYWPNLGYGKFGAQITMSNAPRFDRPEQFDPSRLRMFDVDGSGTTDIVYCGTDSTVTLWWNQAGNGWSAPQILTRGFACDSAATVDIVDLLGTGTGCLVSISNLPGSAPRLRYIDLLASKKPHLVVAMGNGMGLERLLSYAASTKFYLEDEKAGNAWATKLPFPMHVIAGVETIDHLAGTRLVSSYRYRHGFYDGFEREFRGFGMVEQLDAESYTVSSGAHDIPPVRTQTWFHTGAWREGSTLEAAFAEEYYKGDSDETLLSNAPFVAIALADAQEEREAARALKGLVLRQEVYTDDGTALAPHPYTISEHNYAVERLQPRAVGTEHSVFFSHPREELACQYERVSDDPRVLHTFTLDVDDFGNVIQSAAVVYKRRTGSRPEQHTTLITAQESEVTNVADQLWYRAGVPASATSYELHGVTPPTSPALLSFAAVKTALTTATEIPFEQSPSSGFKKRVIARQRTTYYADDLSAELALGDLESLALVHHSEQLALTGGLVTLAYNTPSTTVTSTMLTSECGYRADSGDYWLPSGVPQYDAAAFYLPIAITDPFGNESSVEYDTYKLLVTKAHSSTTTPDLDNVVTFENDYRVLQPWKVTDPNDNITEAAFDALGMVVKTALLGKGTEGDTLSDPTTTFEYNLLAFAIGQPIWAHMTAKEKHGVSSPVQHAYVYSDGSGRELLTKVQAPPSGATPRWIGTGRTIYDNKGNPIKKYEPYFSTTSGYESEPDIVATGVTPILRYDPLGRLIRTDFPDGTYSKSVFDAWNQETWDQNDTVADSDWYILNHALSIGDPMRRAADLAFAHRGTPTSTHFDTLGRPFAVDQDVGTSASHVYYTTTTALDIVGNPTAVTDARSNVTLAQTFDLLKRAIKTISAEAGESQVLPDIAGAAVHGWNSRGYHMRIVFDALHRPTKAYAKHGSDPETLVLLTLYGEVLESVMVGKSKVDNVRGQSYRRYDSTGVETDAVRDFKGNLLSQTRSLVTDYTTTPDWIALESDTTLSAAASHAASQFPLTPEVFTTANTFDALNRVTSTTTPDGSITTPTYDEAQRLETVAANVRGAGSPTNFITSITYNARGQRETVTYANGSVSAYTYDPTNFRLAKLVTTRTSDSAALQDLRYYYDAVGNVVETKDFATQSLFFTDSASPPLVSGDSEYEYDPLYRLTAAERREHPGYFSQKPSADDSFVASSLPHPNDTTALVRYREEYAYDSVGNILSVVHKDGATTKWTRWYQYFDTNNRLAGTSDGSDTEHAPYVSSATDYTDHFTHDARGNMTSMPHLAAMDWDFGDHFQHGQIGSGSGATHAYFVYDAAGNRVRKVWEKAAGLVEERIYIGGYEVWRKYLSGSLDEERQTLHVMDDRKRVVMVETKMVASGSVVGSPTPYLRYQLDDLLGSSRVELDVSAALLSYEEYHPYGTTAFRASSGSSNFASKRYRYTGKEKDDETGLYYYGARYYPPWLGRWTAVDPAGSGLNAYEYCRGNPVGLVDPDGRAPIEAKLAPGSATDPRSEKGAVLTLPSKERITLHLTPDSFHNTDTGKTSVTEPQTTGSGLPGFSALTKDTMGGTFVDVYQFTSADQPKSGKSHETWKLTAQAIPSSDKSPLFDADWEFGVIQNVTDYTAVRTYEGGTTTGISIKGTVLDQNKDYPPASGPYYSDKAVAPVGDPAVLSDEPAVQARPETKVTEKGKPATKPLEKVQLSGTFDVYYVVTNKKTGEQVILWHSQYKVDRTWTRVPGSSDFTGTGSVIRSKDEAGAGGAAPVVTGKTATGFIDQAQKTFPGKMVEYERGKGFWSYSAH